jgi:hypothetical protein
MRSLYDLIRRREHLHKQKLWFWHKLCEFHSKLFEFNGHTGFLWKKSCKNDQWHIFRYSGKRLDIDIGVKPKNV